MIAITLLRVGLGAGMAACSTLPAIAAMLDKTACATLGQELSNIKALDVDKLMANGPDWALTNLSPGDLSIVRKYIELDEQVKFRCTPPSALVKLQGPADDEEAAAAKPAAETADADAKKNKDTGDAAADDATAAKSKASKPRKSAAVKTRTQAAKAAQPAPAQ